MGAALDVAGVPIGALDSAGVREALTAFPRLDFSEALLDLYLAEIDAQPVGAFARLERGIGLSALIADHPCDR